MTKYKLDVAFDYDFDLIGICCHQKDYRLSWSLNGVLDIHLEKADEPLEITVKGKVQAFPYFTFTDEENHVEYQLILNKFEKKILIAEKQEVDFFLLLHNNSVINVDETLTAIKRIDFILSAFLIDVDSLKNKEHLIF